MKGAAPQPGATHHATRLTQAAPLIANDASGLQAITFDVGGTLIKPWPSVGHIYADVAARNGAPGCSIEALNRQFAAAWRANRHFNHSRGEWAEVVDAAFLGLTETPPSRSFFSELYDRFSEPTAWHVFEDVVPALKVLASRGLKLAVISNWDERLRPLLRRLELYDCFDAVVVSCQVGFPKPAREIFQHAAGKLALPPDAILHVGDSLEMDVRGAKAAGLRAALLRRDGSGVASGQIRSLGEL